MRREKRLMDKCASEQNINDKKAALRNLKRCDLSLQCSTVGGESGIKRLTAIPPAELHSSGLFLHNETAAQQY